MLITLFGVTVNINNIYSFSYVGQMPIIIVVYLRS